MFEKFARLLLMFTSSQSIAILHRGYVVNWDLERTIWERVFKASLNFSASKCGLVLTEPLFNLPAIQSQMDQACCSIIN